MPFAAIRTERLLLRPVRLTDATALAARRSEPEVAEMQSWTAPYPLDRAQQIVADVATRDEPCSDAWWMLTITDETDTTILGDVALHPTWDGRAVEIGYTLTRSAWGHGYALEAVTALVTRLWEDRRVTRLHAMTHPDNVASAQVLERTGFSYEGRTRLSYWVGDENTDDVLYGLTRDDWEHWRQRPRTPPRVVRLVEITRDTAAAVRSLTTHKSQERFVATVAQSYGDAMFPGVTDGRPVEPWLRAIEADGAAVGFVMLALTRSATVQPSVWRLLVDRRHQRRGIGSRALDLIVDEVRAMGATSLDAVWREGRGTPAPLFLGRGFEPLGPFGNDGIEARLTIDPG